MPLPVPNLFTPPKAPRFQTAPPPQNQQANATDGQSFKETLGRAKDRSAAPANDDDKPSMKTGHKNPAKQAKQTDQTKDAAESKAKASKQKDPNAGQDAQSQSDDAGQQADQGGKKQEKEPPAENTAADPGAAEAEQIAAIVQIQSPNAAPPQTKSSPKTTDEKGSSSKPVMSGVPRPQSAKVVSQRTNVGAARTSASGDTPAPDAGGTNGQQSAADPQHADATQPTQDTQTTQLKATKPPLLSTKQNSQAATGTASDPSAQPVAMPTAVIDSVPDDSGDASQSLDEIATKADPKNAVASDDTSSQINPSDVSRAKAPGSPFKVATAVDPAPPAPPEAQFADANHARIVSGIHGQLLPGGGSMHIRLDPPELGALNVRVEMRDGVMTAAFETTNDQATKLLSHSLGDLKAALEAQGVSVEKLHVRRSDQQQSSSGEGRSGERQQDSAAQREQQRRDLMRRMWRRLMKGQDPLDLVA